MMYEFIGGLFLVGSLLIIVNKLVKEILELDVFIINKEKEEQNKVEEDWEDDIDKWKDYPYDELDSNDK